MKVHIILEDREETCVEIRTGLSMAEAERLKSYIEKYSLRLPILGEGKKYINASAAYYFESVEGKVFGYLKDEVVRIPQTLEQLERGLHDYGFLRCSKSMILQIRSVQSFECMIGDRMIASLENGEQVVVSRHYAKSIRSYLKEVSIHE